jgi:NAD(P)-dependent dehydrogenase (short-subunit alcohol dehydrogenase family)
MTMKGKTVLVTGANRGIGQALAAEDLARGAKRVYAGTRQPLPQPDDRVTPLSLDVTSTAQIQAAASQVESLDMLINNAGIALPDDLTDPAALERHLAVSLFGTYAVTQAFLPAVTASRGAIVNILSVNALAPLPLIIPAYSVSKAAAFSLTQSLRALVAGQGVRVHAVLPGPVDTDRSGDPTYQRPPRNRSRWPSSTRSTTGRRKSSPIPPQHPWLPTGAIAQPSCSSASSHK